MKSTRRFSKTYEKLGIPLNERKILLGIANEGQNQVAVDAVFDTVSVGDDLSKRAGREGDHLLLASAKRCRIIPNW